MSWIDDDAAELQRQRESAAELAERNRKIANSAEKIYNDLWDEIVNCIAEGKKKGHPSTFDLITNGDPYERRIDHRIIAPQSVKPPASTSKPKYVTVRMSKDRLRIEVEGLRATAIHFLLDLCDDGVVRLKYEGEHKTIHEAAKPILRPLLFPELFGEKS